MTLKLRPEQLELQDTIRSFLEEHSSSSSIRQRIASNTHFDPQLWKKLLDLGMFPYFADSSGEGGSVQELALLSFEAGRTLLSEPLVAALLVGPLLFQKIQGKGRNLLLKVIDNSDYDPASGVDWGVIASSFDEELNKRGKGAAAEMSGVLTLPAAAREASFFVVPSRMIRGTSPQARLGMVAQEGITAIIPSVDITVSECQMTLGKTPSVKISSECSQWFDAAYYALISCELAGLAERAVAMTVDYVKTRKQFGVPIGCFQSVQHQLVDAHVNAESARALAFFAAWAVDNSPDQAAFAARAALWHAREVVPPVIERAIQLHGGIGFTWEHDLHLFLRRAKRIEAQTAWIEETGECEAFLRMVI